MDNKTRKICKLCLKMIYSNEFATIGDITRQMLDILILNLTLDVSEEAVICNNCATTLQNAVDFKLTCLNRSNREDNVNLVLKRAFDEVNKGRELIFPEDRKVCQFCKKLPESGYFTYLYETKENMFIVDMIQKHIPELCLNNAKEIVTCVVCQNSLENLSNFITKCLDVEEIIKGNVDGTGSDIALKLDDDAQDVKLSYEDNCNRMSLTEIKPNCNEGGENITIKCEVKDENLLEKNSQLDIENEEILIKSEQRDCESFQDSTPHSKNIQQKLTEIKPFKCEICSFETKYKRCLTAHVLAHKNRSVIQTYKCDKCLYEAKKRYLLKRHMVSHKSLSEGIIYKCEQCTFQSKYRDSLRKHMQLQHRNHSELYECEICLLKIKHRHNLKQHMLVHQSPSEIKMYKCGWCSHESKRKDHLLQHILTHQSALEAKMYKCDICSFETKFRLNLKEHMLTHRNPSEIKMYKCDICPHETKYKRSLKRHMRKHQNPKYKNI